MRKLLGMKGYRLTLTFAIASVFFAVTYLLTVDRLVVAALFVSLLAAVMLVDTRLQRARQGQAGLMEPSSPRQDWREPAQEAAPQEEAAGDAPPESPPIQPAPVAVAEPEPARIPETGEPLEGPALLGIQPRPDLAIPGPAVSVKEPAALGYQDWLEVLRVEYLQKFVKSAGAAVKFVIPQEHRHHELLWQGLREAAEQDDYLFVAVEAATTRVQMVDELFYEIARQVDWDGLALDFLYKTLADGQYLAPPDHSNFSLSQIAGMNGLDLGEMRAIINNRLRDNLSRYFEITDDFRMAMLKLCQAQLDPQDLGVGGAEAVREWLRGDLKLISALRSASIFEKITRSNGRDMISSLAHWLHLTGRSGLVLGLDISRFLVAKRHGEPDGSIYYSTASVLDGYEVLRQFIDSTDELQFCLIVASAPPTFLSDDQRGVRKYDALYLRIWDEVHDRQTVNPLSTLVRISGQEQPAPSAGVGVSYDQRR